MNAFEKVVKGFAYFLAGIIILSIFSGILFGVSIMAHVFDGTSNEGVQDFHEIYEMVKEMKIDVKASDISIIEGDVFSVDGYDVANSFKVKENAGVLKIEENSFGFWNFSSGKIVVTIPKNSSFNHLKISSGAGRVSISDIHVDELILDQGAGMVEIKGSKFESSKIEGGAGKVEIRDSELHDMKLSAGAGSVEIRASILGDSKIECGVGRVSLDLLGRKEDYRLRVEKGLGSISVDKESYSSDTVIGNGKNFLEVEGGVGSIQINFEDR